MRFSLCTLQDVYVTMAEEHESHLSFMKIFNAGEKLIVNRHEGNLQSRIVYWWAFQDGTRDISKIRVWNRVKKSLTVFRIHRIHIFLGLRIRIHKSEVWIRIRYHQAKKNLDSYCFVTYFWLLSLKNIVNVPSKSNKQKNFFKISFLLASWRSMTKIAGSRSGSISQRHGSTDPHQNVMDPEHWSLICMTVLFIFSSAFMPQKYKRCHRFRLICLISQRKKLS